MTIEQRNEYKMAVERIALQFGFRFIGHGCMCSGGQLLYNAYRGRSTFQFANWDARGYWHLYENRYKIDYGTDPNRLEQKLQELWDISNN